jgi:transcriptional regulator with XRE-family HTH domain
VKHLRNEKFLKAFGRHLSEIRKSRNFSQESLAYESGIELRQIGRIERGEINTGLSSIVLIAETLKIDMKDLFNFKY